MPFSENGRFHVCGDRLPFAVSIVHAVMICSFSARLHLLFFRLLMTLPAAQDDPRDPERIAAAIELIEVTGAKKPIELMLDMIN